MATEAKCFFSIEETAERWGVSTYTVRRLIDANELQSISIAARRVIPLRELQRCEQFGVGTPRKRRGARNRRAGG